MSLKTTLFFADIWHILRFIPQSSTRNLLGRCRLVFKSPWSSGSDWAKPLRGAFGTRFQCGFRGSGRFRKWLCFTATSTHLRCAPSFLRGAHTHIDTLHWFKIKSCPLPGLQLPNLLLGIPPALIWIGLKSPITSEGCLGSLQSAGIGIHDLFAGF